MVLSETFRQSGEIDSRARELDPQNALLHHYPVRRLEAESIRDSILLPPGNWMEPCLVRARSRTAISHRITGSSFSGPLDGDGRRSLYLKVTRMEGARFLECSIIRLRWRLAGTGM